MQVEPANQQDVIPVLSHNTLYGVKRCQLGTLNSEIAIGRKCFTVLAADHTILLYQKVISNFYHLLIVWLGAAAHFNTVFTVRCMITHKYIHLFLSTLYPKCLALLTLQGNQIGLNHFHHNDTTFMANITNADSQ